MSKRRRTVSVPKAIDEKKVLKHLVNNLLKPSNESSPKLDTDLMRQIKSILKKDEHHVAIVFESALRNLESRSSSVRYVSLLLIDELFSRSASFRASSVKNLQTIIDLTIMPNEINSNNLPTPHSITLDLRKKALSIVESWSNSHGKKYNELKAAHRYLSAKKINQFPDIESRLEAEQQELERRELLWRRHICAQYSELLQKKDVVLLEIENLLTQVKTLKGIVTNDVFLEFEEILDERDCDNDSEIDWEPGDVTLLNPALSLANVIQSAGLGSLQYELEVIVPSHQTINLTDDSRPKIGVLLEKLKLIKTEYRPFISKGIRILRTMTTLCLLDNTFEQEAVNNLLIKFDGIQEKIKETFEQIKKLKVVSVDS